ncbi:hypothetical protein Tco_1045072 [Tanacetum coccineum]|uniref:Uncharacterized protein n=1 Tax=Tanacetum coccineum TaxID=301880 RepID=A0ABQ5GRQ6_9ASTR
MMVSLPFTVNIYHDGVLQVNPLEFVNFDSKVIDELASMIEDPDDEQVESKFKAKNNVSYPSFNSDTPWNECKPVLGMRFESPQQLKHMLANYGMQHGYQLWYMQQDHNKPLVFSGSDVSEGRCADLKGGLVELYSKLWQFRQAILDINPGSTCELEIEVNDEDEKLYFRRFYVCFHGVKHRWLEGCRKIIGLDGCFFTHTCKEQLLTEMGRDANNQMFPIA